MTDTAEPSNKDIMAGRAIPTGPRVNDLPEGYNMLDSWIPVLYLAEFAQKGKDGKVDPKPAGFTLFGLPLVAYRDSEGTAVVMQDRCAHRSAPLSIGFVTDGELMCRYHGWAYGKEGKCSRIPALPDGRVPKSVHVPSYPTLEKEGMLWVWLGDPDKAAPDVGIPKPAPEITDSDTWNCTDMTLNQSYSYQCLIENLLDPAHLQFTHEGTQGKYIGPIDKMQV